MKWKKVFLSVIETLIFCLFVNYFSALWLRTIIKVLNICNPGNFFLDFWYMAKYWSSDRIKIVVENVRTITYLYT